MIKRSASGGLPIMMARPFGSTARYWPGTIRRQPLLPNVSWCTCHHVHSITWT